MEEKTILCYGDSNTWGFIPAVGERYQPQMRWTGVLKEHLGSGYRVIEEGLNGRTTVFEDPVLEGRNGSLYLEPCLFSHMPLNMVILMLGTNDLKHRFGATIYETGMGICRLVEQIQKTGDIPILLTAPVLIGREIVSSPYAEEFDGMKTHELSQKLAGRYQQIAKQANCFFMDASQYACPSIKDGIHLEAEGHEKLGQAFCRKVKKILG